MTPIWIGLLAAASLLASPAAAAPAQRVHIKDTRLPISLRGQTYRLQTRVYAPARDHKPFVILLAHGIPFSGVPTPAESHAVSFEFDLLGRWLAGEGYTAVEVMRPGYGGSEGQYLDGEYCGELEAGAKPSVAGYMAVVQNTIDAEAAEVTALRKTAIAHGRPVVIAAHSAGAFAAIGLAAHPPEGLIGVINFEGGRSSDGAGGICGGGDLMIEAGRRYGRDNQLPQAWFYAPNDSLFGPGLHRPLYAAYRAGSKAPVTFHALPPTLPDGHMFPLTGGSKPWAAQVRTFLNGLAKDRAPHS